MASNDGARGRRPVTRNRCSVFASRQRERALFLSLSCSILKSNLWDDDTELLSPPEEATGPEAFLNHSGLALHMARFPEAERRRLHKMICMKCYARNAMRATRCRRCGSKELRPKAKEARKE